MDRREALRKLSVGTAIAVSGPVVLPSFRVAHAASGGIGNTGLVGVPEQSDSPWYVGSDPTQVQFEFDNSGVSCVDGSDFEFSVRWRIVGVTFASSKGWKRLRLIEFSSGTEVASHPLALGVSSGGPLGALTYASKFLMRVRAKSGEKKNEDGELDTATTYTLEAIARWHCPGAPADVVSTFTVTGSGPNVAPPAYQSRDTDAQPL